MTLMRKSYPLWDMERNRSRVVWGIKNDGWRFEAREMRAGQADRWEDREVWRWAEGNLWEETERRERQRERDEG